MNKNTEISINRIFICSLYVLILALFSLIHTEHLVRLLMSAGLLSAVLTYGGFEEGGHKWLMAVQLLIAGIFAFSADTLLGFTVFLVLLLPIKWRLIAMLFSFLCSALTDGLDTAHGIAGMLVLMAAVAAFTLVEHTAEQLGRSRRESAYRLLETAVNEMHAQRANKELIRSRYLSEKNARLLERENISRNIHNSVGHTITAAVMTLDAADLLYDTRPEQAREKMNLANARMRESLDAIRRAVRVLDDDAADISAADLKHAVENIADNFIMDTDMEAYRDYSGLDDAVMIPHEYIEFLTGALQELLTNGRKHGGADRYVIFLSGDSGHIRLNVKDNGKSDFGDANRDKLLGKGFGLRKIAAYCERCGGRVQIDNEDGFRVVVELPFGDAAERSAE